jgi:hypothetical protein
MPAKYRRLIQRLKTSTGLVAICVLVAAGCHKKSPVVVAPPAPPADIVIAEPPAPTPEQPPAPERTQPPPSIVASADAKPDEALFHLGLMYAVEGPGRDWQRATAYLKQVVAEFPQSPLRRAAELVLNLHNETTQLTADAEKRELRIRQLTTELERLKQIDAERRRRP